MNHSDPASPQSVLLTGFGVAVNILLLTLNFGNQSVGTISPAQILTVTNSASTALVIGSMVASGDYLEANTCGSGLLPGGTCIIAVTFAPQITGTRPGAVTVTDNDTTSPQIIPLSGLGVRVIPRHARRRSSPARRTAR